MLSSSGFFNSILCPFFKSGFCERSHCQYKHYTTSSTSSSSSSASSPFSAPSYPCLQYEVGSSATPIASYVPTPVHKLKQITGDATSSRLPSSSSPSTKLSSAPSVTSGGNGKARRPSNDVPEYKPTPISQLKKLQKRPNESEESEESEGKVKNKRLKVDYSPTKSPSKDKALKKASEQLKGQQTKVAVKSEGASKIKNDIKSKTVIKSASKDKGSPKKRTKSESLSRSEHSSESDGCRGAEDFDFDESSDDRPKESAKEENVILKKARVAHQGALLASTAPKKSKTTPAEIMFNRFLSMQSKAKEAKSKASEEVTIDGNKKRVAHSIGSASTKKEATSVGEKTVKRPSIPRDFGNKVPVSVRTRYLNIFIDECLKGCKSKEIAYEKGLSEEKIVYDRCTSKNVYLNLAVNSVKRIRDEFIRQKSGDKSADTKSAKKESPSKGQQKDGGNRVVSHESILNGPRAAGCSIEKREKPLTLEDLSDSMLYKFLRRYVMSAEKLKEYGYPTLNPEKDGEAILPQKEKDTKPLNDFKTSRRTCTRCKKMYQVNDDGVPIKRESCVYHFGRLWNERFNKSVERKYSCCKGDLSSGGCCSNTYHVAEGYGHPDIAKGFVQTKPKKLAPESHPGIYALDCEMCCTTIGLELTRVSVVDLKGKSVYETLVKPKNKVLDHNTKFSGIEEGDLDYVSTTIEDVHKKLLNMFSENTILIGHSLDSDLRALKLIHSTIIDTTEVFPHKRGLPYKRALRTLMAEYLMKIIQGEVGGHDSQEDAVACIDLILWKARQDLLKVKR